MRWLITLLLLALCLTACDVGSNEQTIVLPTSFSTPTHTVTPSITPTHTNTPTPTATSTLTPSPTTTDTPIPTATFSPTPNSMASPAALPSVTPAPTLDTQVFSAFTDQIDRLGMMQTIADLVAFETRHTNSARGNGRTGIDVARGYLGSRLQRQALDCDANAQFFQQDFSLDYQGQITTQTNLILEITGTNPDGSVIVIGAHYDTISKNPRFNPYGFQPGADDNASGVSAVLELARLICLQPIRQSVVLVLFAAEENRSEIYNGRIGSRQFVSNFATTRDYRIKAMMNLDTIGSATDVQGRIVDDLARLYSASGESRQLARRVQAAAYVQLPDFQLLVENREDRQNRWGDHMSFTAVGYPAVRLFEGSEDVERQDSVQDLSNDLDPDYLANNLKVVLAFLFSESDGLPPPSNVVTNGNAVLWDRVERAQSYLIGYRAPDAQNYTYLVVADGQTSIELPGNILFAIGTINANGILGQLSQEYYIQP